MDTRRVLGPARTLKVRGNNESPQERQGVRAVLGSEWVGAVGEPIASCGQGRGRRARAAGARVVSPAVLQPPGAGRQGSASGSFRGGSRLPLAAASVAGRGSAARKKNVTA